MAAPTPAAVGANYDGSGTSAAVAAPSGVVAGSLVVVCMFLDGAAKTVTPPDGTWSAAPNAPVNVTGGSHGLQVFWHRASGSESGSYNFTWTGSTYCDAFAIRFTNVVASGTPFDTPCGAAESNAFDTGVSPAVSTTSAGPDRCDLWVATNWSGGSWTPPTGFTEQQESSAQILTAATKAHLTAGSTGSLTGSCTGNDRRAAFVGAIIGTTTSGGTVSLDAIAAASAATTGTMSGSRPIAATGTATASASAVLSSARPVSATAGASGELTGSMTVTRNYAGNISATGSASGSASRSAPLAATVSSSGDATSQAAAARPIAGMAQSAGSLSGSATVTRPFAAISAGSASLAGDLTIAGQVALAGVIAATAEAVGGAIETKSFAAKSTAVIDVAATVGATRSFAAGIGAAAEMTATLAVQRSTSGDVSAAGHLAGLAGNVIGMAGSIAASSSATATLSGTTFIAWKPTADPPLDEPLFTVGSPVIGELFLSGTPRVD